LSWKSSFPAQPATVLRLRAFFFTGLGAENANVSNIFVRLKETFAGHFRNILALFRLLKRIGNPYALTRVMWCNSDKRYKRPFTWNRHFWAMLLWLGWVPLLAGHTVTLGWNPSPDPNAVAYKVYYGGASRVYTNSEEVGDSTNATISGLMGGATYYFSATSLSADGEESQFSNEATGVIPDTNAPPASLPPTLNAITNVTIFENAGLQTVALAGIGAGSGGNSTVTISVNSSAPAVVPTPTVNYTNSNSTGTLTFAPATNALGTSTITVTVNNGAASNNLASQSFTVTVVPLPVVSLPPTLNAITNVTIFENAGLQTVALTGIGAGSGGNSTVIISANSSTLAVIPTPTVNYTNSNSTGTLTFGPATNALGSSTITVTVNNGAGSNNLASQSFTVTVVPAPVVNPPTLDAITNLTIYESSGLKTVPLAGITPGANNQIQKMTVSAASSNPALIPTPEVNYASPNNVGTLTFAPLTNALGLATVTVTVNDGAQSNNVIARTFTVTVVVPPGGNQPPTLNPIGNINLVQGTLSQNVTLTDITSGSPTQKQTLKISAVSSNPSLIPTPTIRYTSPASTAVLMLKPIPTGVGVATISVTVNNGGKSNNIVSQSFTVTVVSNLPPTLNPIANVTVAKNSASETVVLTGISSGSPTENQVLAISATSSNSRLIPTPTIRYTSPGTNALLTFKPLMNSTGTTIVTVTVNDGSSSNNLIHQYFTITVVPAITNAITASVLSTNSAAILTTVVRTGNQLSFQVTGGAGGRYVIQASSDLTHWAPVQTNTAPFTFQDNTAGGSGQRFYRACYLPGN
jgi:hypothetical protein